jgi:hypothetical protein
VAFVLPDATVTVDGTLAAAVFELLRFTTKPPVGAGPLKVTVPVTAVVELPWTVLGPMAKVVNVAG